LEGGRRGGGGEVVEMVAEARGEARVAAGWLAGRYHSRDAAAC
jgi:hypothetical protein